MSKEARRYTYALINGWVDNSYIVAVKPELVNMVESHCILSMLKDGDYKLFYYVVDRTNVGTKALIELYSGQTNLWAQAAFYGSAVDSTLTTDYDVYQAFIATGITTTNGSKTFSAVTAAVLPTFFNDGENCMVYPNNVVPWTSTNPGNSWARDDKKFTHQDYNYANSVAQTIDGLEVYDIVADLLDDETWCVPPTSVTTVSGGGLIDQTSIKCVYGNDVTFEFPFNPYVVADPAGCSDASSYFTYYIIADANWPNTEAA